MMYVILIAAKRIIKLTAAKPLKTARCRAWRLCAPLLGERQDVELRRDAALPHDSGGDQVADAPLAASADASIFPPLHLMLFVTYGVGLAWQLRRLPKR